MKPLPHLLLLPSFIFSLFNVGGMTAAAATAAVLFTLMVSADPARAADSGALAAYIGTYTGPKSKGVYLSRFDPDSGAMTTPELVAETPNPSFLAVSPNRRFLYAVNEISEFDGKKAGAVSAFAIEPASGKLTFLNQKTTGGPGPCHLSLDSAGKHLFVANYEGGSIEVLPVGANGNLGSPELFIQHTGSGGNPGRQSGPHAHFIEQDPSRRHVLAADLGLDKVLVYKYDRKKGIDQSVEPTFAQTAPGAGPRHFGFGNRGRFLYVVDEINSTVTVFKYNERTGAAESIQALSTLPDGFSGNSSCAEIAVHPSGKFVYASNRGNDSIAVFAVDKKDGRLTRVENQSTRGKTPRSFEIDPSGRWLVAANQSTDNLAVFMIDPETGKLTPKGELIDAPAPVCVKFVRLE